jgi:hypothetical protein
MAYEYLAGPYTGDEDNNFKLHANIFQQLLKQGRIIFSPIVHCHNLAVEFDLPKDFNYWKNYSMAMLGPAMKLIVICGSRWQDSKETQAEIKMAETLGIEIEYLHPLESKLNDCTLMKWYAQSPHGD